MYVRVGEAEIRTNRQTKQPDTQRLVGNALFDFTLADRNDEYRGALTGKPLRGDAQGRYRTSTIISRPMHSLGLNLM